MTARRSPYCRANGFARTYIKGPDAQEEFTICIGGGSFVKPRTVLRLFGEDLLTVRPPEEEGGPTRLTGMFYAPDGKLALAIKDNIYEFCTGLWDVESKGASWFLRTARRHIAMELEVMTPSRISFKRLDMTYQGIDFRATAENIQLSREKAFRFSYSGVIVEPECAIEISLT